MRWQVPDVGGTTLLEILHNDPTTQIVGIVDINAELFNTYRETGTGHRRSYLHNKEEANSNYSSEVLC